MKTSNCVTNIIPALLKAQKLMGGARKGATNPYFKSKYADLGSVLEACKELLNEHGVVILQPHNQLTVETVLWHETGEFVSSETPVVCSKVNDPQALGSAITYARRYGLQSLLSMPAEDDDGEGAMNRTSNYVKRPAATKPVEVTSEAKTVIGSTSAVTTAVSFSPQTATEASTTQKTDVQTTPTAPKKSSFRNKSKPPETAVAATSSQEEDLGLN